MVSSHSAKLLSWVRLGWVWLDIPSVLMNAHRTIGTVPRACIWNGIDIISILRESRRSFEFDPKPGVFLYFDSIAYTPVAIVADCMLHS